MAFNHSAKIKPAQTKNFKGETVLFGHYYKIFDAQGKPIKYCKFQQLDRLAMILGIPAESLPIVT